MSVAYIIANGTSRKGFDLINLRMTPELITKPNTTIYGCNALYRDYAPNYLIPDFLVAIDPGMIGEIHKSDFPQDRFIVPPYDECWEPEECNPHRPRSNAGVNAIREAIKRNHNKIICLGFDFLLKDKDQSISNIYDGTQNYGLDVRAKHEDSAGRIRYMDWVVKENPNISFYFVFPAGAAGVHQFSTNNTHVITYHDVRAYPGKDLQMTEPVHITLLNDFKRIHVRGRMGVQILQAAAGIATLAENEEPILCVNSGGKLDYDVTNKLNEIINPACRVIEVDMLQKTPYWVSGVASRVFTNRVKIVNFLPLRPYKPEKFTSNSTAIHIRGGDKTTASQKTIDYMITTATEKDGTAKIFTNDRSLVAHHKNEISDRSAVDDWFELYHSDIVYATPSAYIMCMLLYNPDKKIIFLSEKLCDGPYSNASCDFVFLYEARNFCKNIEFLE